MKRLLIDTFVFACLFWFVALLLGKPDRPDKTPKKPVPIPQIAGDSTWGIISQTGRAVTVDGHEKWYVKDGEILKDGRVKLLWVQRSDGRLAPSVYTIGKDGSIRGRWAFGDNVTIDKDGEMIGLDQFDTLRAAPEIQ